VTDPETAAQRRKIMAMMDAMKDIAAAVAGYKAQLVQGGISNDVAEEMARKLHDVLMANIHTAAQQGAAK
jgi:hypothetical protein